MREYYPHLTQKEKDEREEFVVEACYTMRDRFNSHDVFERLGLPTKECIEWEESSPGMVEFRQALFTRIVPAIKDIGLWGPKVTEGLFGHGGIAFGDINMEELSANDEAVAEQFDAQRDQHNHARQ